MTRGAAKVVVVGAGLAGLRCAERLGDSVDVVLLEAQDRVGGRCWSSRGWESGQVAEHGGELIEEGQTHVLRVIAELGLSLESRSAGPRGVRVLRDGHVHDAAAVRGFGDVLGQLDAAQVAIGPVSYLNPSRALRELDEMTAYDWIESNVEGGLGSDLGSSLELSSRITLGFDTRSVSAVSLIHLWLGLPEIQDAAAGFRFGQNTEAGPGDELTFADASAAAVVDVSHVAGGNDLIAEGLVARLPPGCLQLVSPVSSIVRRSDGRYVVSVAGARDTYPADHVVLAAPIPALRDIDLTAAGLSPLRHRSIADVPMGTHTKLLMQLDLQPSAFPDWPGVAIFDDPAVVAWDTSQGQGGGSGILTLFTSDRAFAGAAGAHGPVDRESQHRAENLIARVAPGLHGHSVGEMWLDSWPEDPWTGGSYAGFAPGQYSRYAGYLGQPEGRIHFAGEHTSLASWGYLDGAIVSGERAATEVLTDLGVHVNPSV
jgi:monoamine oxidase